MLKRGDVLIRFLPQFQVWHWGIIVEIYSYDVDGIILMEFTDTDKVEKVSLRNFCFYRKYFWVHTFREEMNLYGPRVFRPLHERLRVAYEMYNKNLLTYNLSKYNCEYFCRRCVFNNKKLWESRQTELIARSTKTFLAKLATVILANTFIKLGELLDLEKEGRPFDIRYELAEDSFHLA